MFSVFLCSGVSVGRKVIGQFSERLRISQAACEYNGAYLSLQMEEKRRKYSISSDNSDTTDSKAFHLGLLPGKCLHNYQAQIGGHCPMVSMLMKA